MNDMQSRCRPIMIDKGHDATPSAPKRTKYVTPSIQSEAPRRHRGVLQEVGAMVVLVSTRGVQFSHTRHIQHGEF